MSLFIDHHHYYDQHRCLYHYYYYYYYHYCCRYYQREWLIVATVVIQQTTTSLRIYMAFVIAIPAAIRQPLQWSILEHVVVMEQVMKQVKEQAVSHR